jgi:ATP-dependent Clp protease protease subunit
MSPRKKSVEWFLDELTGSFDLEEQARAQGVYYIYGEIEEGDLVDMQVDLLLKHLSLEWKDEVQIYVNCVGGSVSEAWALIDLMQFVKMDVRTIGLGDCLSAGACILAAGTKGKRLGSPNLAVMVHEAAWPRPPGGTVHQLRDNTQAMEQERERDIRFWLKHSKYTEKEEIEKKFLNQRDHWMTAHGALSHGIIDGVIGEPLPEPPKKRGRPKKS